MTASHSDMSAQLGADDYRPENERDVLLRAVRLIHDRLPPGWSSVADEKPALRRGGADAVLEVTASDGSTAQLVFEAKLSVTGRDVPRLVERLRAMASQVSSTAVPVVAARYLSPPSRKWLAEHHISYVDATGNIRITVEQPALFVADKGHDRDPWRGPGRSRGTLKGPIAARVVRALVDSAEPVSISELISRSKTSTGATYRTVDFLAREGLIERRPRGPIEVPSWRSLLERWSADYGFQRNNSVRSYLHPRGLSAVLDSLGQATGLRHCMTGSLAAQLRVSYAPARLAMVYVEDPHDAADTLGLREVDTGANVLLATTTYDVVFDRTSQADGVTYASPSQTAVDLLTAPGRGPAEATALLDWMESHENQWRQ